MANRTQERPKFLNKEQKLLIGGDRVEAGDGARLDVLDPATGALLSTVPQGSSADVNLAVLAAKSALSSGVWSGLSANDRSKILFRYADLIAERAAELAAIDVLDNGMPLWLSNAIIESSIGGLRYVAMLSATATGRNVSDAITSAASAVHAYTSSTPIGVVGLITPWNGPAGSFLVKVAPALAAGCCCVVKPAENTPLSALMLAEIALEAGVPPGVLNVVTGLGPIAGQALVEHPLVDKISFTGSTNVGKLIVQTAAANLKRVTLELGGKSPSIILGDADLEKSIPAAAMGVFLNSGQLCIAGTRLFAHRSVYDKVVAGVSDVANGLKIGNGFDEATQLGPVISAIQRDRILSFVEESRSAGAEIVAGGDGVGKAGYFVQPTVIAKTTRDMRVVREEVFGPVVVVTPFDELDEVVQQANDTKYGLAAGIFTRDLSHAHRLASQIEAGNIWVNCYGLTHPLLPFGGFKESGWGREFGAEGIEAYRERKSVLIQL